MYRYRWVALFLALVLVLVCVPVRVEAVELYGYNGVSLPALPSYDVSIYSYGCIVLSSSGTYWFMASDDPLQVDHALQCGFLGGSLLAQCYVLDGEWSDFFYDSFTSMSWFSPGYSVVWSDHDVCYSDTGEVYLQASDPVPSVTPAEIPTIVTDVIEPYPVGAVEYDLGDAPEPLFFEASVSDGGTLSYQWYVGDWDTSFENGRATLISGAVEPSYSPSTHTAGIKYYNCVVTNTLNGATASVSSSILQFVVYPDWDGETMPSESVPVTDPAYSEPLEDIKDALDDVGEGLTDVVDSVKSLPEKIIDGIKGLFIPDAESMAKQQEKWLQLLEDRFGAVYESIALVDDLLQAFKARAADGTITIPSVTVPLAGTDFSFGGWTVQVIPPEFAFLVEVCKKIVDILCTFAFLSAMKRRFERTLEG